MKTLLLVLLGVCVVAWGAAYKCSLYNVQQGQARTPVKLCTRASDSAKSDLEHTFKGDTEPRRIAMVAFVVIDHAAEKAVVFERTDLAPQVISSLEDIPKLFRRPPPQSSLMNA